jgi:hypothetical protein
MGFPWGAILPEIVFVFIQALVQPFFWIVVVLIWLMYQRMQKAREALLGVRGSTLRSVLSALGYGVVGGLLGSILIVVLGVSINDLGIAYLWLIAILLMLISPRFLCFSYAGGILALISLLTGHPELNIPALMGLVGVLHLVESTLILVSGHIEPLPVYVRNRFGRVVGAFNLQKFWPIPLAIVAVAAAPQAPAGGIAMPDWWPVLGILGTASAQTVFSIFPVVAALGYGELAVTCLPRERVRRTSLHLAAFSLVLLGLAILAAHAPQTAILAALFAPLGHEIVIHAGQRSELQGQPRFIPPMRGVMVLDVLQGSPAHQAGLRSGDVILRVGGLPANSRTELSSALDAAGRSFEIEFQQVPGGVRRAQAVVGRDDLPGGTGWNGLSGVTDRDDLSGPTGRSGILGMTGRFGVITVPEPGDPPTVDIAVTGFLQRLARRLFRTGAR